MIFVGALERICEYFRNSNEKLLFHPIIGGLYRKSIYCGESNELEGSDKMNEEWAMGIDINSLQNYNSEGVATL